MKPALKSGISIHSHRSGTQVRRGGTSFFVKDSRLTVHITNILGLLDGTRSAEDIEQRLPQPLIKLFHACLSQLQANGMLTTGTLAQAREEFPGVDLVSKFRDWSEDWKSCTSRWCQLNVSLVTARGKAGRPHLVELLRTSGVGGVKVRDDYDAPRNDSDRIIVQIEHPDFELDHVLNLLDHWKSRAIFCLHGPSESVIFRDYAPARQDLQIWQDRFLEQKGQLAELSRQVCDAQIVFELARQTAEEFGLPKAAGNACKTVSASGQVRSMPWQAYLSGYLETAQADGLVPRPSPAFGAEWFSPHGPLRFGEIDADVRYPLPHVAIDVTNAVETPRQILAWGIYPHEAERNAVAEGLSRCLSALMHRAPSIAFQSISVAGSQAEAQELATASVVAQWAASRKTRFAAEPLSDPWSTLGTRCRLLMRILSAFDKTPLSIRALTVRSGPAVIVWVRFDDGMSVGFGPTLDAAVEIALGDYLSSLQIGRRPDRQELPWMRRLCSCELLSRQSAALEDDVGPIPQIHHRLLWEAATPHNVEQQHACCVECWL